MVTQITLGNAFQQNGRTIIGGSQSGFDIKSLVESLAKVKALPATELETANKTIDSQKKAFSELQTILSGFQTAANNLRNPPGVGNASQNVFSYRQATSSTNTGVAASTYATLSVQPGANLQTITIDSITRLASKSSQQSNTLTLADTTTASAVSASPAAGFFAAGTFTLNAVDGGADQSITLNAGDSLQSVVNKFNSVKSHTGIQADIINIGSGTYKIIFNGTKTGAANGFDLTNASTVISDPSGALSSLGFGAATAAQDALFSVGGVSITRANNSISDVLSGVTINLNSATPGGTSITTEVSADTSIVTNAVTSFADAYNKFRLFEAEQTQRNSDGSPKDTAILATDPTLRTIADQITAEVTRTIAGITGTDPARLADVGITFSDFAGDATNPATSNVMNVDTDALSSALSTNFSGVQSLFEYQLNADNTALSTFKRTNGLAISDFTLNIVRDYATSTTNTAVPASTYINVTAAFGVTAQTVTIDSITQLAQNTVQRSGLLTLANTNADSAVAASPTAGFFAAGTFTLHAIDGGADASITLNAGDSLETVRNAFNAVRTRTGITASIIDNANGTYNLAFTGTGIGAANGFDLTNVSTVTSDPSGALSAIGFSTTQTAQDAIFSVNGSSYTRATNTVSDVVSKLTFNLVSATPPATTITSVISNGTYTAGYTDADGNPQTINLDAALITATGGLTLKGRAGTVLDGLQLIFASTATNPSPINVTITQGIADRLYNAMENFINTTNGLVPQSVTVLTKKENDNNDQIAKINDQVVIYRDQITSKYSLLEAALSKANNLLTLLDAQQRARSSNG